MNIPVVTPQTLHERLSKVETVVQQLASDFYDTPGEVVTETPEQLTKSYILSLEQENAGLKAHVNHLREQRDKVNPIIELKDARISELEGIELTLRAKIEKIEGERDQALLDAEFWNREAGHADDYASSIQDAMSNLREKLRAL